MARFHKVCYFSRAKFANDQKIAAGELQLHQSLEYWYCILIRNAGRFAKLMSNCKLGFWPTLLVHFGRKKREKLASTLFLFFGVYLFCLSKNVILDGASRCRFLNGSFTVVLP